MPQSNPNPAAKRHAKYLIGFLSRWPLPLLYALSDLLFVLLFYIFRLQRKLIISNLSRAFPDKSQAEIKRLAAASYRSALDFLFESIKAWRLSERALADRVVLHNPQLVDELLSRHKTLLAVTSHYGNWEWLHLACAASLDVPIAAVYSPLNNTAVDALLGQMRTRFGSTLVAAKNALPELIEFSRHGGIIALNADQSPRPEDEKYWSRFLGIDTAFFTGPARLARLFQAPVVFARMQRLQRGHYSIEFELLCEPPYQSDEQIMQAFINAVEAQILAAPQYWFWPYKRWKYQRPLYADQA